MGSTATHTMTNNLNATIHTHDSFRDQLIYISKKKKVLLSPPFVICHQEHKRNDMNWRAATRLGKVLNDSCNDHPGQRADIAERQPGAHHQAHADHGQHDAGELPARRPLLEDHRGPDRRGGGDERADQGGASRRVRGNGRTSSFT